MSVADYQLTLLAMDNCDRSLETEQNLFDYLTATMRIYDRLEAGGQLDAVLEQIRADEECQLRQLLLSDLVFVLSYRAAMKTRWRNPPNRSRLA